MKSTFHSRLAFLSPLLVVVVMLVCSLRGSTAQETQPPAPAMPDVLVIIEAQNPTANWIAITYPKVVTNTVAQTDANTMIQEGGWSASGIKITNDTSDFPMTSVEFMTQPTVDLSSGYLPVEPIIKALKAYKHIELQYILPKTFVFQGVKDYENRYVQIEFASSANSYRYSVHVKDSGFTRLDLPKPQASAPAPVEPRGRTDRTVQVLIVALAFMAAVVAYLVSARFIRARRRSDA